MTGQPIHFDEPPSVCPRCMTNNPRTITRQLYLDADEERGFPREVMKSWTETVCGTCDPDPRTKRTFIHGQDPDTGRGPFNL